MQQVLSDIKYVVGSYEILSNISNAPVYNLFSDRILCFLNDLSNLLMNSSEAKKYPDVIAFAFWIRKASMEKEKLRFQSKLQRIGRGVVFHIAPSNIPVQFAVSLVYALVSGNISIVKLSDKRFPQIDIICDGITSLFNGKYKDMESSILIIRYGHIDEITKILSAICDARLIWGGNVTVQAIHKIPVSPRCIDIGFADRYSISVIDSDSYLKLDNEILANDFYNDTYFSDQNACSSSRMIIWTGNQIEFAKKIFWETLYTIVEKKYNLEPICGSEKLLKTALCAAEHPEIRQIKYGNLIVRMHVPEIYDDIMNYKGNCGYFFEYDAKKLEDIVPLLKKECQTISYIGDIESELRKIIENNSVRGVDRIVPVGHAADISFIWDGIELPFVLSRCVSNQ